MTAWVDTGEQPAQSAGSTRGLCAVVVVNYGSHRLLRENLLPLHRQDPDLHIVVVDNFSTAQERDAVTQLSTRFGWASVLNDRNDGFGAGANAGVRKALDAGADQVLVLNPDARIERADLEALRSAVAEDPLTMVGPVIQRPDGSLWSDGQYLDLAVGRIRSNRTGRPPRGEVVPWISGACLLFDKQLWQRIGGFDERFFLYWEDVELAVRIQQFGGRVRVVPTAFATHAEGGTQRPSGTRAKSAGYYRYMVRNRLLHVAIHGSVRDVLRWSATAPGQSWAVVLHGGRRQLLSSPRPLLSAAHGMIEGLRLVLTTRRDRASVASDPMVVLQSVPAPRATTNPYNVMLAEALASDARIDLRMFSWREALLHRHDVFHAHWPEILVSGRTPTRRAVRQVLFGALLLKWRAQRVAIVRTVHNLDLPDGISRRERALLRAFERSTTARIRLNPFTPLPTTGPSATIAHGDYRPWYAHLEHPDVEPGRLAFFGVLRRYKGLDGLISAFGATSGDDLTLAIAGRPSTPALGEQLRALAANDSRIELTLDFLDVPALVGHIGRAELVVLPHTQMHNSGSAIAALSLARPVLMQDTEVNRLLSAEVGPGWVQLYRNRLTPQDIRHAVERLRSNPPTGTPDLSGREWHRAADDHIELYREAVAAVGRAGSVSRSGPR